MPTSVVDASALAAVMFAEPDAAQVVALLGHDDLVAPSLLWHEVANVCIKKIRAHPTERDRILAALRMAANLEIHLLEVDHGGVVELADESGLTAYDAAYLWMAHHLGARLVTLDRRLADAWRS
jgi:predicted nucleic acid-binding protein